MATFGACDQCGLVNRAEARFCAQCGAQLPDQVEQSASIPAVTATTAPAEHGQVASVPETAAIASSVGEAPVREGYRSLGRRARWVQLVFGVLIVANVVAISADGAEISLMDRLIAGEFVSDSELDASDSRQLMVTLILLALWVVGAVVFIRWFSAAYRNVRTFGLEPRFNVGWSVGAWFCFTVSSACSSAGR